MKNPLLKVEMLTASYDGKQVLREVDLTLYEYDFLGIIGPNGGGKTTLVKTILGLKKADSGQIRFFRNGQEVERITMGYLPQYSAIDKKFPISVEEVILSGLSKQKPLLSRFTAEQRSKVTEVVQRMGLQGLEKRPIGALSGGQLQRTLLGRAIVSNPDVLILDEPSTYIDKRFEAKLYKLLEEVNKHCAVVLVSHDIGTVLQNVKSIACVNETLHYHPDTEISADWLEKSFDCPIEMLGHGQFPHRVLCTHREHEHESES